MEHTPIFYDSGNGNRLRFLEPHHTGKNIYEDLDCPGRVICAAEDVDLYPREIKTFQPIAVPAEMLRKMKAQYEAR